MEHHFDVEAAKKLHPYLTPRQINYALNKLIEEKAIITGNFNKAPYDRTLWYALNDESALQDYQNDSTENVIPFDENVKPIPYNNTDIKPDKYTEDTDSYKLASYLFKKISERNPGHKQPNMQQWCKHVDLMLRIDKRDKREVAEVIAWCQQDSFWQNNILSTAKLRQHFDQLNVKRKTPTLIKGSALGTIDKAKYERLANNPPKYDH